MRTYYGKPYYLGHGITVITSWQSRGAISHNTKCYIKDGDTVLKEYPFYLWPKAIDEATQIMLDKGRTLRLIRESIS